MQITYNMGQFACTINGAAPQIGATIVMSGKLSPDFDTRWKVVDVIHSLSSDAPGVTSEFVEVMLSPLYNNAYPGDRDMGSMLTD